MLEVDYMEKEERLNGWLYIVYMLVKTKFNYNCFYLDEIYAYSKYFSTFYPDNNFIKEKIRQSLQVLVKRDFIVRIDRGKYQLVDKEKDIDIVIDEPQRNYVYLVSNESMPGWVKIGRTQSIEKILNDLYNSSVPFPFKLEKSIETQSMRESLVIEKGIHELIDKINPKVRKDTAAKRREFFNISVEAGIKIFDIVIQMLTNKSNLSDSHISHV